MRLRSFTTAALALLLAASALAGTVKVSGTVVDAKGKAAKGVTVGVRWSGDEKKLEPGNSTTTQKDGSFEIELNMDDKQTVALVALDKAERNMGYVEIKPDDQDPVKIELAKTLIVNGTFDTEALATKPGSVELIITSPDNVELLRVELPAKRRFALRLAPGNYQYAMKCEGGEREAREMTLPEKKTSHNLGKLALRREAVKPAAEKEKSDEKKPAASGEGREPPKLTVSEARGVRKDVKLSDYRGKWVLLEFWGYW